MAPAIFSNSSLHNNSPPQKDEHTQKLNKLIDGSESILLKASSVFPFDFFPDELVIDKHKVCIIAKEFFLAQDIHSIMIDLIKDVEVETSVFFGTLKVVPDGYPAQPVCIRYLRKEDALKAQRIIQGLMVSNKQGVKVEEIQDENLCEKVEKVGSP